MAWIVHPSYNLISFLLAQFAEIGPFIKLVKMISFCLPVGVCLGVNQGGTNRNDCTHRLVIFHAQTY